MPSFQDRTHPSAVRHFNPHTIQSDLSDLFCDYELLYLIRLANVRYMIGMSPEWLEAPTEVFALLSSLDPIRWSDSQRWWGDAALESCIRHSEILSGTT